MGGVRLQACCAQQRYRPPPPLPPSPAPNPPAPAARALAAAKSFTLWPRVRRIAWASTAAHIAPVGNAEFTVRSPACMRGPPYSLDVCTAGLQQQPGGRDAAAAAHTVFGVYGLHSQALA